MKLHSQLGLKRPQLILLGIFTFVFALRLYFTFNYPNFTYESYFHLKHIAYITQHGLPLYHDLLSYGGRTLVFLPAFHYFLSFFNLILPLEFAAKLIPNLLTASLIPLTYFISKRITQRETPSLLAAALVGFLPILWQTNSLSPTQLFLPLTFLAIYSFMNLSQKKFIYLYLISIFFLSLTSSATLLLIIGLFLYLLLSKIEDKKISRAELEISLFSLFLFLWLQFLFFKNILLQEGPRFIWQNIPQQILNQYFPQFSITQYLLLIGIIPLLAGIFTIYQSFFHEKNKNIFLLFSLAISTVLLFILKIIELKIALPFLALILAILFSQFYKTASQYIKHTKFAKLNFPFLTLIILILALTLIYPCLTSVWQQPLPSKEETQAFFWLRENTPQSSTILATLKEGHLINYLSQRKNLMDDQFSLIPNIETRFNHINLLFTTSYQTQALDLSSQYGINYIIVSPQAKQQYQINNLDYVDKKCFELVHSNIAQIYQIKCQLEPTKS